MRRTLLTTLAAAALAVSGAQAALAGASHEFVPESYDEAETFAAGEGFCVPWAGTFHEVRTGGYTYLTPPGGQVRGEAHVNGVINGQVALIPDDPTLPTYAGTYREKVNAIVVGTDAEGFDVLRLGQYRLTLPLAGSDGSTIILSLSGKVTVNAKGVTTVSRDVLSCG
jgi:hypothetical protein